MVSTSPNNIATNRQMGLESKDRDKPGLRAHYCEIHPVHSSLLNIVDGVRMA